MSHTRAPLTSFRLDHRFGPTLTYPSTTRRLDDTAGISGDLDPTIPTIIPLWGVSIRFFLTRIDTL